MLSAKELLDSEAIPRMSTAVKRYVAHSQAQLDGRALTAYKGDRSWQAALSDIWRWFCSRDLTAVTRDERPRPHLRKVDVCQFWPQLAAVRVGAADLAIDQVLGGANGAKPVSAVTSHERRT